MDEDLWKPLNTWWWMGHAGWWRFGSFSRATERRWGVDVVILPFVVSERLSRNAGYKNRKTTVSTTISCIPLLIFVYACKDPCDSANQLLGTPCNSIELLCNTRRASRTSLFRLLAIGTFPHSDRLRLLYQWILCFQVGARDSLREEPNNFPFSSFP